MDKPKECQKCWWFCHENSKCYQESESDDKAIPKKPTDTCNLWLDDLS